MNDLSFTLRLRSALILSGQTEAHGRWRVSPTHHQSSKPYGKYPRANIPPNIWWRSITIGPPFAVHILNISSLTNGRMHWCKIVHLIPGVISHWTYIRVAITNYKRRYLLHWKNGFYCNPQSGLQKSPILSWPRIMFYMHVCYDFFSTVAINAVKRVSGGKRLFLASLQQTCNGDLYLNIKQK